MALEGRNMRHLKAVQRPDYEGLTRGLTPRATLSPTLRGDRKYSPDSNVFHMHHHRRKTARTVNEQEKPSLARGSISHINAKNG